MVLSKRYWRRYGHVPVMIALQVIFIILFAVFVVYNPENAVYGKGNNARAREMMKDYPRKRVFKREMIQLAFREVA